MSGEYLLNLVSDLNYIDECNTEAGRVCNEIIQLDFGPLSPEKFESIAGELISRLSRLVAISSDIGDIVDLEDIDVCQLSGLYKESEKVLFEAECVVNRNITLLERKLEGGIISSDEEDKLLALCSFTSDLEKLYRVSESGKS